MAFSAGTDLAVGAGPPTPRGGGYGVVRRDRATPLIAAVEGLAYGGGFEIVLACDLVVAARTARFALPETARGLVANCGALFRAPRALPLNIAREMLLTGDPLDAERAWSLGLVNRLVEPGTAEQAALELAERDLRERAGRPAPLAARRGRRRRRPRRPGLGRDRAGLARGERLGRRRRRCRRLPREARPSLERPLRSAPDGVDRRSRTALIAGAGRR